MLVQNMPGAGSIVAAKYLYGVAKPDGLKKSKPCIKNSCNSRAKLSSGLSDLIKVARSAANES